MFCDIEGTCEYIQLAVAHNRQGVVLLFYINDIPNVAIIDYNFTKHCHFFVIRLNVSYKLSERERTCD